jgi:hypothetical protein
MAHFAKLDENNIVLQVVVISNNDINNLPFPESEPVGSAFCKSLFGSDTRWVQTSYNANFRYNYAGIGYTFDPTTESNIASHGAFITPKPYDSWLLNTMTFQWEPPVPYPNDGQSYYWDEETQSWKLV